MAASQTARLIASLELKDLFSGTLGKANKALGTFDAKLDHTQGRAFTAGQQIGTGIKNGVKIAAAAIGFLGTQVVAGTNQLIELEDIAAQTSAALASTKGVSGQSVASVRALAEEFENLNATIDDKVIQSGENVLLTFTNIGEKAFKPALAAALDLSVGMKQDLQTSVVQLGKALNDPIKGLTSLSRIGVKFTDDQKETIRTLVKEGDLFGAQQVILQELGTEFGGRFAAQGKTAKGTIAGIGDAVEDLQKAIATALFPTIQKVLPKIREFLASPQVLSAVNKLGDAIAGLFSDENIATGSKALGSLIDTAQRAAPAIADAAGRVAGFVGGAVKAFLSLPKEIQAIAVGGFAINKLTGGLVTNIAGGIIETVGKNFFQRGATPANPLFVADVTGGIGKGGGGLLGALGGAAGVATIATVAIPLALIAAAEFADPEHKHGFGRDDPQGGITGRPTNNSPKGTAGGLAGFLGGGANPFLAPLKAASREESEAARFLTAAGKTLTAAGHDQSEAARFFHASTEEANKQRNKGIETDILGQKRKGDNLKGQEFHIPQRIFLETHTSAKAIKIADIYTGRFASETGKYYRSETKARAALDALKGLQQRFLAHGDTKSAARVGRDITKMREIIKTAVHGTTKAVDRKKLSVKNKIDVHLDVDVKSYLNSRTFNANLSRYATFLQEHGG